MSGKAALAMAEDDQPARRGRRAEAAPALHRRIRTDIETKIVSGDWPPGHRIPFEQALAAEYGCARMTVNKVLTDLARAGVIERRRRAGSFVRRPHGQAAVLEIPDIKAEIEGRGQLHRHRLISQTIRGAGADDMAALDVPAGAPVLTLRCVHMADGLPFALEDRRINLAAVPEARGIDFSVEPPNTWLLREIVWTQAEHRIGAAAAGAGAARALAIGAGSPCLAIDRRTWRGETCLTAVHLLYPGALYDLVARFSPSGP